jgi:hypothetical protein
MPLGTKGGLIIVKDGKLAENCECCPSGCCGNGESLSSLSASVTITWTYNTNPSGSFAQRTCWPINSTTQTQFATWDQVMPTNIPGGTGPCSKGFVDSSLTGGPANQTAGSFLSLARNIPPYTTISIAPVAGICQLSFYTAWANPGCSDNNAPLQIPFMTWEYNGPGTYLLTYHVWSAFRVNPFRPDDPSLENLLLVLSRNSLSATSPPTNVFFNPDGSSTLPPGHTWYMTATANVSVSLV